MGGNLLDFMIGSSRFQHVIAGTISLRAMAPEHPKGNIKPNGDAVIKV